MSQENEIEAKKLRPTTDLLPSDEATCCASLAEKITVALLTPWQGEECHRLQIMRKTGTGFYDEQNMGGRNKDSIFETVLEIIEEHSRHN